VQQMDEGFSVVHATTVKHSKIDSFVFSGGGSRGAGILGAITALSDADLMSDVKSMTGSSVGSMTAALMAVGVDLSYFDEEVSTLEMEPLVNQLVFTGPNIIPWITSSTQPLELWVNRLLLKTTRDFLNTQPVLSPEMQAIVAKLVPASGYQLTFGDLEMLHQHYPEQFKRLYVPAAVLGQGNINVFSHQTQKVAIARACAASAAIPGKFAPVKIEGIYYQDAVLSDPLPVNACLEKTDVTKTLLFLFYNRVWDELIHHQTELSWQQVQADINRVDQYYIPLFNIILSGFNSGMFFAKLFHLLVTLPLFYIDSNGTHLNRLFTELVDLSHYLFKTPVAFSQKEVSSRVFTTLRNGYANQTILLNSGAIGSLDFVDAKLVIKEMQAMYYLNTLLFLIQNQLYRGGVFENVDAFYQAVIEAFQDLSINGSSRAEIYDVILNTAKRNFSSTEAHRLVDVQRSMHTRHRLNRYGFMNSTALKNASSIDLIEDHCAPSNVSM
jgi:predicted acylesterase/phospholipase RssA